jgi:hypothetical protein
MSTVLMPIDNTWQNVQAGPELAVSISATGRKLYYQLTELSPAQVDQGHTLNPGSGVGVEITDGDNLWVRVSGSYKSELAVTL